VSNFIHNALPVIVILTVFIFFLILLIRLIIRILLYFAVKNYRAIMGKKKKKKLPKLKKNYIKEEDEKFREKKEFTKPKNYQIIPTKQQRPEIERPEIVDIVKPVGFWTSMVLGQKLTYLVSSAKLMNQSDATKGFWTSMVEAQARAQGRERGRGRF